MTLLPDGRIGFYWEEGERPGGYDMAFKAISVEEIVKGK
jgi:hypothetical protein